MASNTALKRWDYDVRREQLVASEPWLKPVGFTWPQPVTLAVRESVPVRHETWIAERLRCAATMLRDSIDIDLEKRGGVPVVHGTRVPVATILAELAEDATLGEIADALDLDANVLRTMIQGIAIHLDRPFLK